MIKLLKYEFRKTMFSKVVLLIFTAIAEALYLSGVFLKWEYGLGFGTIGLSLCAIVGILYIGIETLRVFHNDLNTKQSYMLFLTPRNSFQILGAKVLENGLSLFFTGLFYALLTALDVTIAVLYIGGLEEFLEMMRDLLAYIEVDLQITWQEAAIAFSSALAGWLMTIVTGYLAIVLCATVLAGKKLSGFFSFVFFLILNGILRTLLEHLPESSDVMAQYGIVICAALLLTALMYVISGWIMERRLNV